MRPRAAAAAWMLCAAALAYATPPTFPLAVSPNSRYLIDAARVPFPILGDSGWGAMLNINASDQTAFEIKVGP